MLPGDSVGSMLQSQARYHLSIYALIYVHMCYFVGMSTVTDYTNRINHVLHLIHSDITAEHSARQLASAAAWSEAHFHRVFRYATVSV